MESLATHRPNLCRERYNNHNELVGGGDLGQTLENIKSCVDRQWYQIGGIYCESLSTLKNHDTENLDMKEKDRVLMFVGNAA